MYIEHIAMYVSDLEAARIFFENYFNARSNDMYHNQTTGFSSYFLTFDQGTRLEIMTRPDITNPYKDLYRIGFIHIAFALGSKEAVDKMTHRLQEDGYEVISGPRTTGDGYYESAIIGFEGNQIEITV